MEQPIFSTCQFGGLTDITTKQDFTFTDPINTCITFQGSVQLFPDGHVEIAEGMTVPEAAMAFWEAVNAVFPTFLEKVSQHD